MATIKTIRGEREYPTKQDYVAACVEASRRQLADGQRQGFFLEQTSVRRDAYVATLASEDYDMSVSRGLDLRSPESY